MIDQKYFYVIWLSQITHFNSASPFYGILFWDFHIFYRNFCNFSPILIAIKRLEMLMHLSWEWTNKKLMTILIKFSHYCLEFVSFIYYYCTIAIAIETWKDWKCENNSKDEEEKEKIISIIEFSRQKDKKEENWVKILKRKFPKMLSWSSSSCLTFMFYRKIRKNILFHPMRLSPSSSALLSSSLLCCLIYSSIIVSQFGQFDLKLAHTCSTLHLTIEMNPCAIKTLSFE